MYPRSIACCLSLFVVAFLSRPALADHHESGEGSAAGTDSKSMWVTSIARLGTSDQFVASTADGLLLREASVYSFNAANPTELTPIYSHPAAVWRIAATSDGGTVASVDYRGNLVVFDVAAAKSETHEKAFERWCQAMMISPDDKSIVAGNEAGKVIVWDLEANKVSKSAELDGHAVTGLAVSPDGSQLAASDGGGHIHLLKWPSLEEAGKIEIGEQTAWCVAFVDDGKNLLVGSSDRHLYRCEAKADAKAESIAKGSDWITQLAVSPGGQVAAGEVGGRLHFPSTGGTDSMDATSGVWTLCWNGDEQLFAGTRKDGIVMAGRSWKWTQPAPPAKEEPKEEPKEEAKPEGEPKKEMKEEAKKEDKPKEDAKDEAKKKDDKPKDKPDAKKEKQDADKKPADTKKPAQDKPADAKKPAEKKPAEKKPDKPADKDQPENKGGEKKKDE